MGLIDMVRHPAGGEGAGMLQFAADLFPICRSITGRGVRQTLAQMAREIPLEVHEVPSGTRVFDWVVPEEWNIETAFLEDPQCRRIVDFADHNLHVMSYSTPVDTVIDLSALQNHLHSDPTHPDWIPYRTSYYSRNWAFCLPDDQRQHLQPGNYRAVINSELTAGSLTYGEFCIPGSTTDEVLIYSHLCHPSLANDNLSGLAVTVWLAKYLQGRANKLTYRFVWGPGTIGSITWLALNETRLDRIRHGLVCCLLGRPGPFHYKRTPGGMAEIDIITEYVVREHNASSVILPFDPYGYDERQFCSPGLRLPIGRLTRLPNGAYPEYHSSADDLSLLDGATLEASLHCVMDVCEELDGASYFVNTAPKGEPQLGRRGLYHGTGGMNPQERQRVMLWLLNQSDGRTSLRSICQKAGIAITDLLPVVTELEQAGLLTSVEDILGKDGR